MLLQGRGQSSGEMWNAERYAGVLKSTIRLFGEDQRSVRVAIDIYADVVVV